MAADGYVIVEANLNTKGFERGLAKMSSSANSAGSAVAKGLGRSVTGAVKTMGKAAVGLGVAVGTAMLGALAYTLKKGLNRALDIQDAKSTLKSLGYSVKEIEKIADNTIEAVKGTPYALNDAMKIATSALASGVKEGKELTKYIQLVGDAATVAKIPMGDMGQIFNKVSATGKVTGEVLMQLSERGIPALQLLAEEYGVTAEEMQGMVRKGEVSSARFLKAIEKAFGGAALEAGNTLRGSVDNLNAAFGRLGEKFWTENLPKLQDGIKQLTDLVDDAGPSMVILGELFGDLLSSIALLADGDISGFEVSISQTLSNLAILLENFMVAAIPAAGAFISGLVIAIASGLPTLLPAFIEGIIGLIEQLVVQLPTIASQLADGFFEVAKTLFYKIPEILPELQESLFEAMVILAESLALSLPLMMDALIQLMIAVFEVLTHPEVLDPLIEGIVGMIEVLVAYFPELVPALVAGLIRVAAAIASAIIELLPILIPALITLAGGILRGLFDAIFGNKLSPSEIGANLVRGLWNGISNMAAWIKEKIGGFGESVVGALKSFFGIKSPSKLFEKEIGVNLALGVGSGFEKSISKVVGGMERSLTGEMGRFSTSVAPQSAVSTSQVINFYSPVQSYSETVRAMRDIERGLAF